MSVEELQALIDCPVDWYGLTLDGDFAQTMRAVWYLIVREHEVDQESNWLSDVDYELSTIEPLVLDDESDWLPDLVNVRSWIHAARSEYSELSRPFISLRAASREDYPKHFVASGASDDRMRRASRNGRSLLSPEFGPEAQLAMSWAAIAGATQDYVCPTDDDELISLHRLRDLLSGPTLKVYVEVLGRITGYAYGAPTSFACFDLDLCTPILHVYPVSRAEYSESASGIQGFAIGKDYIY